jgi:hypothetical protein
VKEIEVVIYALIIAAAVWLAGCSNLGIVRHEGELRKATAWGVYCVPGACGVGYVHTEVGPGDKVKSDESFPPTIPLPVVP